MSRLLAAFFAVLGCFTLTPAVFAEQEWGTIKGQILWAPDKLPEAVKFTAPAGVPTCVNVKGGNILLDPYVVDPKSKGVRWCVVWLLDKNGDRTKPIPIKPDLKAVPKEKLVLDQPCCTFEPRVICLREGQTLIAQNSAAFAHNTNIAAANFNELIAPGGKKTIPLLDATTIPTQVACNIHPWMKGWIGVFKHPYFAVTDKDGNFEIKDAPAGAYRIVAWQEEKGYITTGAKTGQPIDVKPNDATEVKLKLTPKD
jgi:hypothetical protein